MNSPIGDIHGLGEKTLKVFTTAGYTTVGQLYNSTPIDLQERLNEAIKLLQEGDPPPQVPTSGTNSLHLLLSL